QRARERCAGLGREGPGRGARRRRRRRRGGKRGGRGGRRVEHVVRRGRGRGVAGRVRRRDGERVRAVRLARAVIPLGARARRGRRDHGGPSGQRAGQRGPRLGTEGPRWRARRRGGRGDGIDRGHRRRGGVEHVVRRGRGRGVAGRVGGRDGERVGPV